MEYLLPPQSPRPQPGRRPVGGSAMGSSERETIQVSVPVSSSTLLLRKPQILVVGVWSSSPGE